MWRRLAILAAAVLALGAGTPAAALGAADPLRPKQWGLDMIESDAAHGLGVTGTGATVAVVDTGVRLTHQDLVGQLSLPSWDFIDGDAVPDVSPTGEGHGTHVTGIIVAAKGNGLGVAGVAPGARALPVRVLADNGVGTDRDVAAGITYATDRGAQVINLSIGEDLPLSALTSGGVFNQAIEYALNRGVVIVAAAGNSGAPVCNQPSGGGRLLCVGAVDRRGQKASYSNFGYGLGITAPGGSALTSFAEEDIFSTYNRGDGDYRERAGTSQATPHVAGVAALLVARGLRGQDVVRRLLATATDAGVPGPDAVYGAGIVNARRAVASTFGGAGGGRGAGGSGSTTGGSNVATGGGARVSVPRSLRISRVLRRGIPVRCLAAGSGVCAVRVRARGRTIASGSARVRAGVAATARARVSRRGRRVLRGVRRKVAASARVSLPGADGLRLTFVLRR